MTYQLVTPITSPDTPTIVYRIDDALFIPFDENNTDYQAYLAWVADGNTAEEWTGN